MLNLIYTEHRFQGLPSKRSGMEGYDLNERQEIINTWRTYLNLYIIKSKCFFEFGNFMHVYWKRTIKIDEIGIKLGCHLAPLPAAFTNGSGEKNNGSSHTIFITALATKSQLNYH